MIAPSLMDLALQAAENAANAGEVPIGCVIVRNGEVIATAGNRTLTDRDPTAHAEILAIRQAAVRLGSERPPAGIGSVRRNLQERCFDQALKHPVRDQSNRQTECEQCRETVRFHPRDAGKKYSKIRHHSADSCR